MMTLPSDAGVEVSGLLSMPKQTPFPEECVIARPRKGRSNLMGSDRDCFGPEGLAMTGWPLCPQLVGEVLETLGDKGKIVLGLEVAGLLCAVLIGTGDEGGLHAVRGGADEVVVVRRDHHHRAGI